MLVCETVKTVILITGGTGLQPFWFSCLGSPDDSPDQATADYRGQHYSSRRGDHTVMPIQLHVTRLALFKKATTLCVLQLLAEACNSVCEHLLDFLTNRYATHVARRLLCIVAGRDVLPRAAKSRNKVGPLLLSTKAIGVHVPPKVCVPSNHSTSSLHQV